MNWFLTPEDGPWTLGILVEAESVPSKVGGWMHADVFMVTAGSHCLKPEGATARPMNCVVSPRVMFDLIYSCVRMCVFGGPVFLAFPPLLIPGSAAAGYGEG